MKSHMEGIQKARCEGKRQIFCGLPGTPPFLYPVCSAIQKCKGTLIFSYYRVSLHRFYQPNHWSLMISTVFGLTSFPRVWEHKAENYIFLLCFGISGDQPPFCRYLRAANHSSIESTLTLESQRVGKCIHVVPSKKQEQRTNTPDSWVSASISCI